MPKIKIIETKEIFKFAFYFSLFFGFLIFGVYFISIQYVPVVNLQSVLYLPLIASFLGLLLFFGLLLLFAGGPLLWSELLKSEKLSCLILSEENLSSIANSYKCGSIQLDLKLRNLVASHYLSSMLILMGFWFIVIHLLPLYFFQTLLFWGLIAYNWLCFTRDDQNPKNQSTGKILKVVRLLNYSVLPSFILFITFVILGSLLNLNSISLVILFAFCVVVLSAICLFPMLDSLKLINWCFIVSGSTILFLLISLGAPTNLSTKIIHSCKLGDIQNVTLNVDNIGCEIFKANGIKLSCSGNQIVFSVSNITILWRIGEYYLQDANNLDKKFIMPTEHILSIGVKQASFS